MIKREQTIYFGGPTITMDEVNPHVEAVAVEEGKIVATGSYQKLSADYPQAEQFNLNGQTLLPAFIENHSHILLCGNMETMHDLSFFKYQEQEEMMQAFRSMTPNKDGWLMGIGWDVKKQQISSLKEIDEVHPDLPMFITMQGHGAG